MADKELLEKVNRLLEAEGILLGSDSVFPSVAGTVTEERIHGSWWGHPQGREIFSILKQLTVQPDIVITKLVAGKTTLVHRSLWPEFLSIAKSHESWQMTGLSRSAEQLLTAVTENGQLLTTQHAASSGLKIGVLGDASRDLERRILVYSQEFHTEKGAHAKKLETWDHWAVERKYRWNNVDSRRAKDVFETRMRMFEERYGARRPLPWDSRRRKKTN